MVFCVVSTCKDNAILLILQCFKAELIIEWE